MCACWCVCGFFSSFSPQIVQHNAFKSILTFTISEIHCIRNSYWVLLFLLSFFVRLILKGKWINRNKNNDIQQTKLQLHAAHANKRERKEPRENEYADFVWVCRGAKIKTQSKCNDYLYELIDSALLTPFDCCKTFTFINITFSLNKRQSLMHIPMWLGHGFNNGPVLHCEKHRRRI